MAKPEMSFRIGNCAASVFRDVVRPKTDKDPPLLRRYVLLQRCYLNGHNDWQTTYNFRLADLPAAITVLQMALDYVASHEGTHEA